jgi:hypothetical protein
MAVHIEPNFGAQRVTDRRALVHVVLLLGHDLRPGSSPPREGAPCGTWVGR